MRHKKIFSIILLLCFLFTLLPTSAFAATLGAKVTATIPTFKVTMNGQVVDNTYRQYPFLVYNDITYFPMTYWDMRFLGVSNTWSAETGSVIVADGNTSEYKPTLTDVKNKTKNTAVVNTGAFKVNGKVIDNAKEQYPILSFRDVPYFPLTWNWCQEFGWNISFDGTNGLAVNTTKQTPSKNTNNELVPPNTTEVYKITANELQDSCWVADNTNSIEVWAFGFEENSNEYAYLRRAIDKSGTVVQILEVKEGSFVLSDGSLVLTQEIKETSTQRITGEETTDYDYEKQTFSYSIASKMIDGKLALYIDGRPYYKINIDEINDLFNARGEQMNEQAESIIEAQTSNTGGKEEAKPTTKYSAGMYKVGTDIPAGLYILISEGRGYFSVTADANGDNILVNDNFGTNSYIDLKKNTYFTLNKGYAVPYSDDITFEAIDNGYLTGMYKVGKDIPAGTYKLSVISGGYYGITDTPYGHIISNDYFYENRYITVENGQYLDLSDCYVER